MYMGEESTVEKERESIVGAGLAVPKSSVSESLLLPSVHSYWPAAVASFLCVVSPQDRAIYYELHACLGERCYDKA